MPSVASSATCALPQQTLPNALNKHFFSFVRPTAEAEFSSKSLVKLLGRRGFFNRRKDIIPELNKLPHNWPNSLIIRIVQPEYQFFDPLQAVFFGPHVPLWQAP